MIEYLTDIENTRFLRDGAEFLTVLISLVGMAVAIRHAMYFSNSDSRLARRIKQVFITDGAIYLVTLIMGLGLFLNMPVIVHYDVLIRPLALVLNVYASWRLYVHYKKVG